MGSGIGFLVFPLTTISHVVLRFKVIRFSIDQRRIFCTSTKYLIGTLNVVSSAYFNRRFLFGCKTMKSLTVKKKKKKKKKQDRTETQFLSGLLY